MNVKTVESLNMDELIGYVFILMSQRKKLFFVFCFQRDERKKTMTVFNCFRSYRNLDCERLTKSKK